MNIDNIPKPTTVYNFTPSELIVRMLKGKCEFCGCDTEFTYVYQVSAMSVLSEDVPWEATMLKKRRKTLIMCKECFEKTITDV